MTKQVYNHQPSMAKCNKCDRYIPLSQEGTIAHIKQYHSTPIKLTPYQRERAMDMLKQYDSMLIDHKGLTKEQVSDICRGVLELQRLLKGE